MSQRKHIPGPIRKRKCTHCRAVVYRRPMKTKRYYCNFACKAAWQRLQKPVTREWLYQKYIVEGLDCTQIAKIVNRNSKRVWEWLINEGIQTRPRGHDHAKKPKIGSGAANAFFGRKHTPEMRKRMSEKAKSEGRVPYDPAAGSYMKGRRGSETPNWKGGITPERQAFYQTQEWKAAEREVKKRDKQTCQRCGKVKTSGDGLNFDIHHIVGFACVKLRAVVSNLVYLCEPCHYWVHGKENVNNEFIKEIK